MSNIDLFPSAQDRRTARRFVLALGVLFAMAAGAVAQPRFLKVLPPVEDAAKGGWAIEVDHDFVRRNPPTIEIAHPADGRALSVQRTLFEDRGGGNAMWVGRYAEHEYDSVVLTLQDGSLLGYFGLPEGGALSIRSGGGGTAGRMDETRGGVDCGGAVIPEFDSSPPLAAARGDWLPPESVVSESNHRNLDILLFMTQSAANNLARAGYRPVSAAAQQLIDYFNLTLRNSRVSVRGRLITVRYTDGTSGNVILANEKYDRLEKTLYSMRQDPAIKSRRTRYQADIVHLIFNQDDKGYCGKAYVAPRGATASSFSYAAYGVTNVQSEGKEICMRNSNSDSPQQDTHLNTFAHEIGHNLGLNHQPSEAKASPSEAIEPYAFGFRNAEANLVSVMAYSQSSEDSYAPVFSTPSWRPVLGRAGRQDNVRAVRRTIHMGVRYSDYLGGGTPGKAPAKPTSLRVVGTSDTSVRLTWRDRSNNETGFRVFARLKGRGWQGAGSFGRNTQSASITGLQAGGHYYFLVRAWNSSGHADSDLVSIQLSGGYGSGCGSARSCSDCTHEVSYFKGSGGLIAKAKGAKVSWVAKCGEDVCSGTLRPNSGGIVSTLFNGDNRLACRVDGGRFEIGPIEDGGWFWVTDARNSAVGSLIGKDVLGGDYATTVPVAAGPGVTMTPGRGATFVKETASGRVGILPNILPTNSSDTGEIVMGDSDFSSIRCSECSHVVSYYKGNGGLIAKADGVTEVHWMSACNGVFRSGILRPNDDGIVSTLFNGDNRLACRVDGGRFAIGPVKDGGWFWITDDRNSAIGSLIDKDVLGYKKTAPVAAGSGVTMLAGDGASFVKETATGRIGILPNILPNSGPGTNSDLSPGSKFRDCAECPEMVVIGPGSFRMGSPESEEGRYDDEGPQRSVTIAKPFALGVHEVTFDEWEACVNDGGCGGRAPDDAGWGKGRRPVINVSWEDAQSYVSWLSRETGESYRLPSEAEWEYAARAGTATSWFWGEDSSKQCRYANGDDGYVSCSDGYERTSLVGTFSPNAWGLHDMSGNVWEWVADCWHDGYAGAPTDGSVWPGGDCELRVLRGGSWGSGHPRNLRSANRDWYPIWNRYSSIGFRVARTLD